MEKTAPATKTSAPSSEPKSKTQLRQSQASAGQGGDLAQLSAIANRSPQVRTQLKLAGEMQGSQQNIAQQKLAAEINAASPVAAQFKRLEEKKPMQQHKSKLEEKKPVQRHTDATAQAKGKLEDKKLKQPKMDDTAQAKPKDEKLPGQRIAKEEKKLRQHKFAGGAAPAQLEEAPSANRTGLPDQLKSGVESLSGISLDSVKVHYNSDKPAQLNALAYAQGTDIHVAPGQEQHLPHEAWHVVQQAQGRVKPTMQMKEGVPVNDDKGLEHEADVMGAKALTSSLEAVQRKEQLISSGVPVAQKLGTNVNIVDEENRFFETPKGKSRLRVNPDADAYLEDHFEKDSAAKLTNASLGEKFSHAMDRVHKGIPYNKQNKIDAFDSNVQPTEEGSRKERSLGYMLHTKSATCWEKAAHFHLILAELGITTFLEGGYSKTSGGGHAWLVIPASEEAFGGKQVVVDPDSGTISNRTTYEGKYNITVAAKQVATPKVAESPKAIEKALKEFQSLEDLGGIVKQSVLGMVDLKIERAMNDKKREKEQVEWNKLLLNFQSSLK